jgi:hypothetical protein
MSQQRVEVLGKERTFLLVKVKREGEQISDGKRIQRIRSQPFTEVVPMRGCRQGSRSFPAWCVRSVLPPSASCSLFLSVMCMIARWGYSRQEAAHVEQDRE